VIDLALEGTAPVTRIESAAVGTVAKRRAGAAKTKDVEAPKKITFRFQQDEDYRLIPVNGVWGGVTPRGDIKVDFFHESTSQPEVVTQEVTPDGVLGKEVERIPSKSIDRTVLVGMVLSLEHAESISRWLQDKAREVRERREATGREKEGGGSEPDTPRTH
jgi:hypothetical protein